MLIVLSGKMFKRLKTNDVLHLSYCFFFFADILRILNNAFQICYDYHIYIFCNIKNSELSITIWYKYGSQKMYGLSHVCVYIYIYNSFKFRQIQINNNRFYYMFNQ